MKRVPAVLLLLVSMALSQGSAPESQIVIATIADRQARPPQSLLTDGIIVTYDRKPVTAQIKWAQTPADFVVVVDTSNSSARMNKVEDLTRRSAVEVFQAASQLGGHGSLIAFATLISGPVGPLNAPEWKERIADLRFGDGTALYDAVDTACRAFSASYPDTRRAVFVISDGDDNQSRYTHAQAITACQQAHATVFSLIVGSQPSMLPGSRIMREFALKTGGAVISVDPKLDVGGWVAALLQRQYEVRVTAPASSKMHDLRVSSSDKNLDISAPAKM